MRGRHSYGILKMIEVEETIAYSEQEYIEIAVKLGNNLNWREKIKNKIKRNKHKLFNDMECIKGLEEFLVNAVANLTLGN
jgi:predicted O-linked N-acetylglucosamine transferase (SPINDLY family)